MKRLVLAALFLCACNACGGAPPPDPLHPEPKPDPYEPLPPVREQTLCERFCALLDGLNCPGEEGAKGQDEIRGTADDTPCVRVCEDTLSKGTYHPDAKCLDRATTCAAAGACVLRP